MHLALFDFDETLIKENSLSALFKQVASIKVLWWHAVPAFFTSCCWKKGIRYAIKKQLYQRCLAGVSEKALYEAGKKLAKKFTINHNVLAKLVEHSRAKHNIWIVTASPEAFISGVLAELNWPHHKVIGSQLETKQGAFTGGFPKECSGMEKVVRIHQAMEISEDFLQPIAAYGNLPPDRYMLEMADKGFVIRKGEIAQYQL